MDTRYKDVRQIFDFATSVADEMLADHPEMTAEDIVTISTEIAINNLEHSKAVSPLPVGNLDRTKMAFVLQDGDSAALIMGDFEFAVGTGKTVYAKDPDHIPEDEENDEE